MDDKDTKKAPSSSENGGNGGENKKNAGNKTFPRMPKAAVVWLIILLAIGALALFRDNSESRQKVFTQSEFESMLRTKRIVSADVTD